MANKSVSLLIIFFCNLLGSHCLPPRSSASHDDHNKITLKTLNLFLGTFADDDDDHNKIGVGGSTPGRDSLWNGNSSPSGNILLSPPTSLTHISMAPPMTVVTTSNGTNSHQKPRQRP
ncbi:hypothetical protein NL676_037768 [Syzygium grande]|nr:hypothetical protein NL676_037768 [Syzygium grande]